MEIDFRSKKLARQCNTERELLKAFGGKNGTKIMARLALLSAAPGLADVPTGPPEKCHELKGDRKGQFAVTCNEPFRLVFVPNHDPLPRKPDGGIDLTSVTSITIISMEDYHR